MIISNIVSIYESVITWMLYTKFTNLTLDKQIGYFRSLSEKHQNLLGVKLIRSTSKSFKKKHGY